MMKILNYILLLVFLFNFYFKIEGEIKLYYTNDNKNKISNKLLKVLIN